jgi:hydrophobe/amphiphile efflux-1 (HAE1) family protein
VTDPVIPPVGAPHTPSAGDAPEDAPRDVSRAEYPFVRRPVLAIVLSLVITLLGVIALRGLPINRYPPITPPSVQVTAVYPGASAQDVSDAVAGPIEQQLAGLDGLLYYRSSNTSDGVMNLSLTFDIARDQDLAAVDVQNAVSVAEPQLPAAVRQNGVTVTKANADVLLVGALTSSDPRYDAAYLSNYAKLYLENDLKRLPGVGNATVFGTLDFSMLVSLDPERMARLGITVEDVAAAVQDQNATKPGGRLGREPAPTGTQLTVPVTTEGRLSTPAEFGAIVVRARGDGALVRVRDVAAVTLGARGYDIAGRLDGRPTALFAIYTRPGGNSLAVKAAVTARLDELARAFPAGVRWSIPFDTTPFITESIREVVITLAEAMALVIVVVFVFLQSWRATLIPVLAVPVSIVGTFVGLQLLGFTINTLTLFAMVLAIGIVVDDAIVVVENVERLMAQEGLSPRVAASRAMRQVAGALVAIVLVLCAVFIPVAFAGGITGRMYTQFAATIATAVVLSGVVALTLTPALCAMLLKPAGADAAKPRVFRAFDRGFDRLTGWYTAVTGRVIGSPRAGFAGFALLAGLVVVLYTRLPGGFLPTEDKGYFAVSVRLPDAASLQRTQAAVARVEAVLRAEPAVQGTVAIVGLDLLTQANQTNTATLFVMLTEWGERGDAGAIPALLGRVNGALGAIPEAVAFGFNLPEIPGLGTSSGLELNLQQRAGGDVRAFARQVQAFTPRPTRPACSRVPTPRSAPTCRSSSCAWTRTRRRRAG